MPERCVLAVFAHPDDEAFGTAGVLRRYADVGLRTAVVCATRGEAGEIADPALATPETLGAVREGELRAAAEIMGVSDLTFLDYHDGTLAAADHAEALGKVVREIRRLQPQVVITFDRQGGYGHTDHIAIHHITLEAFERAGDPEAYPEQLADGLEPWQADKLYAVAMPRTLMQEALQASRDEGLDFNPGGDQATIPLEQMGTPDDEITTAILLTDREYDAKMRTMHAHATQLAPGNPIDTMPEEMRRAWLGTERFVLLHPAGAPGDSSERDLFAGL